MSNGNGSPQFLACHIASLRLKKANEAGLRIAATRPRSANEWLSGRRFYAPFALNTRATPRLAWCYRPTERWNEKRIAIADWRHWHRGSANTRAENDILCRRLHTVGIWRLESRFWELWRRDIWRGHFRTYGKRDVSLRIDATLFLKENSGDFELFKSRSNYHVVLEICLQSIWFCIISFKFVGCTKREKFKKIAKIDVLCLI